MRGLRPIAAAAALALSAGPAAAADGDPAKGKSNYGRCVACHALEKGRSRAGPSLHCILGRKAATARYRYSKSLEALGKTGFAWDEASLFAYLADPRGFLKKQLKTGSVSNKMLLRFPDEAFRRDVIAYLKAEACN